MWISCIKVKFKVLFTIFVINGKLVSLWYNGDDINIKQPQVL